MAAPSKNLTAIADSQIDADSPLDTTLITSIRDSLVNLSEQISYGYTPAQAHNHDGLNSPQILDGNVSKSGGLTVFDDFLGDVISNIWTLTSAAIAGGADNGVARITTSGSISLVLGKAFRVGANTLTFEARVKMGAASPNAYKIGLGALNDSNNNNDYIGIANNAAGANFLARSSKASTVTSTDTGVVIDGTSWWKIKFVATSTSVLFYINDVLKATHTTNIPIVNLGVVFNLGNTTDIDYVQVSSSARL